MTEGHSGRRRWLRQLLSERVRGFPGRRGPSARPDTQGYEGAGHGRQRATAGPGKEASERQSESQEVVGASLGLSPKKPTVLPVRGHCLDQHGSLHSNGFHPYSFLTMELVLQTKLRWYCLVEAGKRTGPTQHASLLLQLGAGDRGLVSMELGWEMVPWTHGRPLGSFRGIR